MSHGIVPRADIAETVEWVGRYFYTETEAAERRKAWPPGSTRQHSDPSLLLRSSGEKDVAGRDTEGNDNDAEASTAVSGESTPDGAGKEDELLQSA